MAKNRYHAQVVYHENYGTFGEGYALEISSDGGKEWGLQTFFPCQHCEIDPENEKNHIHYSIIPELSRVLDLGYKLTIL